MRWRASLRSARARALASSSRFDGVGIAGELSEPVTLDGSLPGDGFLGLGDLLIDPTHGALARSAVARRWLPFPGRARVHAQSTQETGSSSHRGWQVKFQTWRDRRPGEASNQRRAA